ncbi:hypothetical protein [Xanthomonas albilineans]|uniref:hypothetical protein n=1 Tax=Xanthomonas albilineans TaxID=29447 RepID=UPI0005F3487B|nr:hypothetical protein [Xanthomonas albilineans]
MTEQPKNQLISLLALSGGPNLAEAIEREKVERARQEAEDRRFESYCYKRLARIKRWGMTQEKETLAEHLSLAALLLIERKKTERHVERGVKAREEMIALLEAISAETKMQEAAMRGVAEKYVASALANRADRRRGAAAKLANDRDGKQAAKAAALELWKERHAGKHPTLRTVEQFAIEVMRRWPVLTSSKVICGWSTKWSKSVREGRPSAC